MDGTTFESGVATRIVGLDASRLVATLGVVWLHLASAIRPSLVSGRFGVPYFIVIATFLATKRARGESFETLPELIRDRAQRILKPFLVWSAIVGFARVAKWKLAHGHPMHIGWLELALEGTASAYWFLPFIFFAGVLALVVGVFVSTRPRQRNRVAAVFAIAAIVATSVYDASLVPWLDSSWRSLATDSPGISVFTRYWFEIPMVCAAIAIAIVLDGSTSPIVPRSRALVAVAATGFVALTLRLVGPARNPPCDHLVGLVLVLIALSLPENDLVRGAARLGRHGYFVYLSHVILIWPFIVFAQRAVPDAGLAYVAFATVAVTALGIGASVLARRTGALRWLVP